MYLFLKSSATAVLLAAAIQCFTLGLAPRLPNEVLRPGIQEIRTLSYHAFPLIQVQNHDGAIVVNTHEKNSVLVTIDIRAYTPTAETRVIAEQYVNTLIGIREEPESLILITEPGERPDEVDLRVDYTLTVPLGTNIDAECTNGNVWISAGCGRIAVDGTMTDIDIYDPVGPVMASSRIGRIALTGATDSADLDTVNGSINANMRGGALRASTVNGSIYATLLEPDVSDCDLTAMNGGITIILSEMCSADIHATTGRGSVTSDLPVTCPPGITPRRDALHGLIGEGRTRLTMDTLIGNIWITRSST